MKYQARAREQQQRAHEGEKSALRGLLINFFLAGIKILTGIVGHSYALIADGVESLLDIFSSAIVWAGLRIAGTPPDKNHHYGHGKAEAVAAFIVAMALLLAAIGLAIQSVREIITPHHAPEPFTLVVLIAVVVIKEWLYRTVYHVGNEIESTAVKGDAWHHRSDMLTSLAAFIGISISLIMGPGYEAADDWCALAGCLVIAYNGIKLLKTSIAEIMDTVPSFELEYEIRGIAEHAEGVHTVETCRIRKSGVSYFVDLHIEVDGTISVQAGHEIAHLVKDLIIEKKPMIYDVMVHVEPVHLDE